MKKALAWVLVLALTAAVAVGGTLAYLTDTDEDVNVMTIGKVKIDQLEFERIDTETTDQNATVQEFHDNKPLYPAVVEDGFGWTAGDSYVDWEQIGKDGYTSDIWDPSKINNEVDKMVFVKNKGDYDAYVRSVFAFEAGKYTTLDEFQKMVHLNLNETEWTWEWNATPVTIGESTYFVATATYNEVLKPGALTEISLSQIALDKTATNADVEAFGETYQVLVKTQAIQADGFDNAEDALTEGFGSKIPFENDNPIKGIDLRTALHYLDGDKAGTKITAKVTNVIFALNEEYPAIVDSYDGTLVDVEQDVPVYAYYVPNGSNYDVYFLANDTIYSPKDSSELFLKMSALKTVDTGNYDVSRVVNMYKMFRECTSLTTIDVSDWDTSNVTNMAHMFRKCSMLDNVDVADWDLSNVTSINSIFCQCGALTELDVSNWNTSNVTDMVQVFMDCTSLSNVDVSNWNVAKVKRFKAIFATTAQNTGKMKFTDLDVSDWDVSSATDFEAMFYGCGQLTSVNMSDWNVEKLTTVSHMFADCYKLETVNVSGWNTDSLTSLDGMFNNCESLTVIDLSSFTTDKVKEFSQLFEACKSLEKIIGLEDWDTTSGHDFSEMFSGCGKLKELDLSSFDTRNANADTLSHGQYENWMFLRTFSGLSSLEKITFGPYFSFDGDGSAPDGYKAKMSGATSVEGWDGYWYDADGTAYAPADIPEEMAATYYAVNPVKP